MSVDRVSKSLFPHLEEVGGGLGPDALVHVHLAAALADDGHDARVRDRGLDGQRPLVQLLQLLRVLLLRVYLCAANSDLLSPSAQRLEQAPGTDQDWKAQPPREASC